MKNENEEMIGAEYISGWYIIEVAIYVIGACVFTYTQDLYGVLLFLILLKQTIYNNK